MKIQKYILPVALASFAMGTYAQADPAQDNLRSHQLTVSLKGHYEGEATSKHNNNGVLKSVTQKILTQKISNKQILEALVDNGLINSIKGWSLILVTDDEANIVGVFIDKKKNIPIDITQYFNANAGDDLTEVKGKYNSKKDVMTVDTKNKSLGSVSINFWDLSLNASGILNFNKHSVAEDTEGENLEEAFMTTADFSDLTGTLNRFVEVGPHGDDAVDGLVTGSIKAAKGKAFTYNLGPILIGVK
jgi:hypothetical protein